MEQNREFMETNRQRWEELVPHHTKSEFYHVDEFIAGRNSLNELELREVGDVDGKNLLHLQCHFGLDTLSWARLGAFVTGVDFSDNAIEAAKELAQMCQLDARFLCCNLYDLPQHLMGQFDIVYTSYGVLDWLPDLSKWGEIAASYLRPGGFFYIADFHPFAHVFDDESKELRYKYSYYKKDATRFEFQGSYATVDANISNKVEFNWIHTMEEIIGSLISAGLQIESLHEFPFSTYKQLAMLVNDGNGIWRFPEEEQTIPLMFSLKAIKPI